MLQLLACIVLCIVFKMQRPCACAETHNVVYAPAGRSFGTGLLKELLLGAPAVHQVTMYKQTKTCLLDFKTLLNINLPAQTLAAEFWLDFALIRLLAETVMPC